MKNIVIIEDHPITAFNLNFIIESSKQYRVVGIYNTGNEVYNAEFNDNIDVALVDISLPDTDGFEVGIHLRDRLPSIKLIAVSSFSEKEYISKFLEICGNGYLVKGCTREVLLSAIESVLEGNTFLCDRSKQSLQETIKGY